MCTCNTLRHMYTCGNIYIFNAPETDSAYIYTCKDIHYGLSFTLIYTCKDIHLLSYIHARIYIYSHIYMQGHTLRFIIYYLILLNLTLADPHIELILARLSYPGQHQHHCQQHHPKSCNLITNHTPHPPQPSHCLLNEDVVEDNEQDPPPGP